MRNAERATLVRQYCLDNLDPIQDLCPEFNQYFKKGNKYQVWNSRTGKRTDIDFDPTRWSEKRQHTNLTNLVCVRSDYEGFYVHYVEELDALEIARVWMDGNRGKDDEPREWYFKRWLSSDRCFIFHDDSDPYNHHGSILTGNGHYAKELLVAMKEWSRHCIIGSESYDEFHKFSPESELCVTIYGWHIDQVCLWQYARWYQMEFIKRTQSKKMQDITRYKLNDIHVDRHFMIDHTILFEKLDDNYAVLRLFKYPSNYDVLHGADENESKECARLFITDKGKPTLIINEYGTWKMSSSTPWDAHGAVYIVNLDEMERWKPLKYILPCLDMDAVSIQSFINILRHPIIEQVCKAGYPQLAKEMSDYSESPNHLKTYYLVERERKLPMFKLLGVNKYVMNAAEKYGNPKIIREIKYFVGGFDATEVPQDICNYIAEFINSNSYNYGTSIADLVHGHSTGYRRYSNKYDTPLTDDEKKWIMKLFRMEAKHAGCINLFDDIVKLYNRLNNKPDIDIYNVKGYEDMTRLHDALIQIQIQEDQERKALQNASEREKMEILKKKFDKLQEDRVKKFEYDGDDFCIRVPHDLTDITREGIILNHCVGGYVEKHAQGATNIIFLRSKADENAPFYTLEITNNNRVVQIHGKHNRWLGNNPEAVPFMYKYLNHLGAIYDTKLLLNKGAGYCPSGDNLDESYLVA